MLSPACHSCDNPNPNPNIGTSLTDNPSIGIGTSLADNPNPNIGTSLADDPSFTISPDDDSTTSIGGERLGADVQLAWG